MKQMNCGTIALQLFDAKKIPQPFGMRDFEKVGRVL